MPKILFHSNRLYNYENKYTPSSTKKEIPKWFSEASKYWKHESDPENYIIDEHGERSLGFKSCPALLDIFSFGYTLKTPCDLFFYQENNKVYVKTEPGFEDFCDRREPMAEFVSPEGYHKDHFHWWPNWGIELPKGYSLLVLNPINRYDLPFLTVGGIIDSDDYILPGLTPFFIQNGFSGIVPAGTPYLQVIPFKREDWSSELKFYNQGEMIKRHKNNVKMYRVKKGGIYKRFTWKQKKYE